ncbi:MAG: hypothetical protein LBS56_07845, partial [Propionibacteriaceae bacterium]|nr:hypothetical protein [Propionibacteriaceae bacterium]
GDDAFFRIMRTWFDRYANSNASTWDFIALAEEVSGRELTAWADDYLFSDKQPTWPTLQTYPAAVADDCGGTALTTCALEDRVGRSATLGRVGDRDWFKLTPGRAGEYTITLDAQASADRLDLALLDSEGHEVPGAEAGIDAAGDLVLTWALAQGTDYFVAVTADPGASLDGPVAYTVTADVPESSFMEVLRRVLDRLRELIARLLTVFGVFPG